MNIPKINEYWFYRKYAKDLSDDLYQIKSIGDLSKSYSYIKVENISTKEIRNYDVRFFESNWVKALPHEIPTNQSESMSKEELLAKAKRDYPVGTKYRGVKTENEFIVGDFNALNYMGNNGNPTLCFNPGFLYRDSQWAEIISKPEVKEEVKPFTVGGWVKVIKDNAYPKLVGNYYQITDFKDSLIVLNTPSDICSNRVLWINDECEWIGMGDPNPFDWSVLKPRYKGFIYNSSEEIWSWQMNEPVDKGSKVVPIDIQPLQQVVELRNSKKSNLIIL